MNKKIFIHVGYPKTGTSSLQHNLFSNLEDMEYLRRESEILNIRRAICNKEKAKLKKTRKEAKKIFEKKSSDRLIYSEEAYTEPLNARTDPDIGPVDIVQRLHTVFDPEEFDTEIIISIRKQQDLLLSWFSFMYQSFEKDGINDINVLIEKACKENDRYCKEYINWLDFKDVLGEYVNKFGEERVNIMTYEDMKRRSDYFMGKMSNMLGINKELSKELVQKGGDRNVSRSEGNYYKPSRIFHLLSIVKSSYLSFLESPRKYKFGGKILDFIRNYQKKEINLSDESLSVLKKRYAKSNSLIEKKFGIELEGKGYFVEPSPI